MLLEQALAITGNLGKASKMPCHTWSISAWHCQRGSKLREVEGSVCNKCYAVRGNFGRPTIQAHLNRREQVMQNPQWVDAMVAVLTAYETSGYFRWFASGDIQSLDMLLDICEICRRTPHIKHWLPTHEVGILGAFRRAGHTYPSNLTVRLSADMIDKPVPKRLTKSLGVLAGHVSKTGKHSCPASEQNNMCQTCRACWDKRVPVVTYKYH